MKNWFLLTSKKFWHIVSYCLRSSWFFLGFLWYLWHRVQLYIRACEVWLQVRQIDIILFFCDKCRRIFGRTWWLYWHSILIFEGSNIGIFLFQENRNISMEIRGRYIAIDLILWWGTLVNDGWFGYFWLDVLHSILFIGEARGWGFICRNGRAVLIDKRNLRFVLDEVCSWPWRREIHAEECMETSCYLYNFLILVIKLLFHFEPVLLELNIIVLLFG